jgi:2-keto-myo-inositol isomerase
VKIEQLAINAVSTTHSGLVECLDAYSAAGFKKVEFPMWLVKDYMKEGHTIEDVKALLDDRGMQCIGGWECHVACFWEEDKEEVFALLRTNAELISALGGTGMVCGTDGPKEGQEFDDVLQPIVDGFSDAADMIADTGVTLYLEFNWSPIVKSLRTGAEVARRTGKDNVRVVFDPAHYHCTPSKFSQLTPENVAMIGHVHVNNMADKPGELCDCNGDRVLPAEGCLDLPAIFGKLEECGYKGDFSIEMFTQSLYDMPASEAAAIMYQSLLPLTSDG